MPRLTKKNNPILHLDLQQLSLDTWKYIKDNMLFVLCIFAVNMVYMLMFMAIPKGIANPLSIIWFITYYIFWCFFYRYYYHLKPYFLSKAILGSLSPSTKAMLIIFVIMLSIVLLPILPLFLGLNDVYIDIYERYLKTFEGMSTQNNVVASVSDIIIGYGIMTLLAPILICKPYLAWISSLRGRTSSFQKIRDKTKGNYWNFVVISFLLLYPQAIAVQLDKLWNCQNWLNYTVSTIIFVYTNIVFAKIYDWFYIKN